MRARRENLREDARCGSCLFMAVLSAHDTKPMQMSCTCIEICISPCRECFRSRSNRCQSHLHKLLRHCLTLRSRTEGDGEPIDCSLQNAMQLASKSATNISHRAESVKICQHAYIVNNHNIFSHIRRICAQPPRRDFQCTLYL